MLWIMNMNFVLEQILPMLLSYGLQGEPASLPIFDLQTPVFSHSTSFCPYSLKFTAGLGTIHLRRRQIFTIFDPYPPTIDIPAKCL